MLKRALAICTTGLLLLASPGFANDDDDDPFLLGSDEEAEKDEGPDYARDGFYVQAGITFGIARTLEDKLNQKRDQARLAPVAENQFARDPVRPISDDGTVLLRAVPGMPFDGVRNSAGDCETTFIPGGPPVARPCPLGDSDVSNGIGANLRVGSRVLPNLAVELQLEYMANFETKIPGYSQDAPQLVPTAIFPTIPCPGDPSPGPCNQPTQLLEPTSYVKASDTDKVNVDILTLSVNLKVPILTGRIQPYGLLGGGVGFVFRDNKFPRRQILPSAISSNPTRFEEYVHVQDAGAIIRVGGGVDSYINEHIYISTEAAYVVSQGEAFSDLSYWGVTAGVGYRF